MKILREIHDELKAIRVLLEGMQSVSPKSRQEAVDEMLKQERKLIDEHRKRIVGGRRG